MPTISKDNKCVTLINVFTVEPSNQQKLINLLAQATETSLRHVQGFISASFHRSLDGTKVTAYAQWRSAEDYQAMRKNPVALPYMEQAIALTAFDSLKQVAPQLGKIRNASNEKAKRVLGWNPRSTEGGYCRHR